MNKPAKNRANGKKDVSYRVRMHKGLLQDLHKAAKSERRSTNAEICLRLENSLVRKVG